MNAEKNLKARIEELEQENKTLREKADKWFNEHMRSRDEEREWYYQYKRTKKQLDETNEMLIKIAAAFKEKYPTRVTFDVKVVY